MMRSDYYIYKNHTNVLYEKKNHTKREKSPLRLLTAPATILKICQKFWLQNIDFIIAIKFPDDKNMSLFTPGRFYYSCKQFVKYRGSDIHCKIISEPESPQEETQ